MYGRFGVQLFFLVSAFTLMLSHESRTNETQHNKKFYIRRIFRIVPLYYIALIYYSIDSAFFSECFSHQTNIKTVFFADVLRNAAFLNNFYPNMKYYVPGGWSIVVEMTFYLLLPLIWKYVNNINKALLGLSISLLISFLFTHVFLDFHHLQVSMYTSFFNQFPTFMLGILIYFIVKKPIPPLNKWIILLLGFSFVFYAYFIQSYIFRCFIASLFLFCFVLIVQKKQYKLFVNPTLSYLGKISFSMYIIHFGVLYWMKRADIFHFLEFSDTKTFLLSYLLCFIVLLLLTIPLSHFTYLYYEKYFMKKGKLFIHFITKIK